MTTSNGNRSAPTTPPPGVLGDLSGESERALLERAVRASHAAHEEAGVAAEYGRRNARAIGELSEGQGRIIAELARQAKRLGVVEREPRGSSPALEEAARIAVRFADLHLADEDTQVRERRLAQQRRVDMWSGAKRVARWAGGVAVLVTPAVVAWLIGWL